MMPALALPGWLHTQAASYASLVLTPFLHEDVAVVVAASYIEGRVLSATQAFSALYLGVVASDLAIFALGRLARTWTPVRRFMPETRVEEARRRLPELLSRAANGERFVICRHQQPQAALVPLGDQPAIDPVRRQQRIQAITGLQGSGRHCWNRDSPRPARPAPPPACVAPDPPGRPAPAAGAAPPDPPRAPAAVGDP